MPSRPHGDASSGFRFCITGLGFPVSSARIVMRGGHAFEIREGSTSTRPDETWSYDDPAGHTHRWVWPEGGDPSSSRASLPTCHAMQHRTFVNGEELRRVLYECALCRAPVEPGVVHGEGQRYLIDGVEVTYDEFTHRAKKAGMPEGILE